MGYDVTVKFKNLEDRERMKSFIRANSDILLEMEKVDSYGPIHDRELYDGEELGYAPNKKNLLGFHGTGIPKYIWNLCAWMAIKADCKDKKGNHFFYYDSEKMIVTFDKNNKKNTLVNEKGIPVYREQENSSLPKQFLEYLLGQEKALERQRELFVKLNEKWKEYELNKDIDTPKLKKNKP